MTERAVIEKSQNTTTTDLSLTDLDDLTVTLDIDSFLNDNKFHHHDLPSERMNRSESKIKSKLDTLSH
jgi:hypothetical protein